MKQTTGFSGFKEFIVKAGPVSEDAWMLMQGILETHELKKGELTLHQGQVCRFIDYIETGSFRIFYNKDGVEFSTGLYTEGVCITDMKSLSQGISSELTFQANEKSIVTRFYKDKLVGLYAKSPELQAVGRSVLESMVVNENSWKEMYMLYDPTERYNFVLQKAPELILRFPMQDIASFLGIRRETLSRIRSKSKNNH